MTSSILIEGTTTYTGLSLNWNTESIQLYKSLESWNEGFGANYFIENFKQSVQVGMPMMDLSHTYNRSSK
jgi:hypothetical protein